MARPQKTDNSKRDEIVRTRFSRMEKQKLVSLAGDAGLTLSDYIRAKTIAAPALIKKATPDRAAFIRSLADLGKIGSNVNQIARALNRTAQGGETVGVSKELIEQVLRSINNLTTPILKLLEKDGHSG